MKTIIAAAVIAGATVLAAAPAFAEANFSVGYVQAKEKIGPVKLDAGVVRGTVAYKFNRYFGVEGEAGLGVKDDKLGGQTFKVDHEVASYLTATAPVSANFDFDARVGIGQTRFSTKGPFGSAHQTNATWNYGAGAEYFFSGANGARLDYTKFDGDGFDADAWSVSYVRKF